MGSENELQLPALTFFRQRRLDDGERMGILLHGDNAFEVYEPGVEEYDPTLIWSVELLCDGPSVPTLPLTAMAWLKENACIIQAGMRVMASGLELGIDKTDLNMFKWDKFPTKIPGAEIRVSCYAMRRIDGRVIGEKVSETAEHFLDYLEHLATPVDALDTW